jgi:hypothetical protein
MHLFIQRFPVSHPDTPAFVCSNRIIDNKTLRLITESSDYSPTKDDKLDNSLRGNAAALLYFGKV